MFNPNPRGVKSQTKLTGGCCHEDLLNYTTLNSMNCTYIIIIKSTFKTTFLWKTPFKKNWLKYFALLEKKQLSLSYPGLITDRKRLFGHKP
jgi:hypothetical protein